MAQSNKLNTIIGMGVFPYMSIEEQLKHFQIIYKNIPNFLIEIKYNSNTTKQKENCFTLENLQ